MSRTEPQEDTPITLADMEELVLKHQEEGIHKVRTRGQLEAANELRQVAYSDIANILYEDSDGNLKMRKLTDLPPEVTRSIKKIKVKQERTRNRVYDSDGSEEESGGGEIIEIELWDKMAALDKLMRHLGGYEQDNQQKKDPMSRKLDSLLSSISDQGISSGRPMVGYENDPYEDVYSEDEDEI